MRQLFKIKCYILPYMAIFVFSLLGCNKELVILPSPKIEIVSAKSTDLSTYVVDIKIDLGEGQNIKGAKLIFDDITIISATDIVKEITLSNERYQEHTISLHIEQLNHDFAIKAFIETEYNKYYSNEEIIRTIKNTFHPWMVMDNMYGNENEKIADCLNKGERFTLFVNYLNDFTPQTVDVRLNKIISLEHNVDFSDYSCTNDFIRTSGKVNLPENINPGVYEIYLYVDGHEFKAEHKIKVLDGEWNVIDSTYPGEFRGDYASFLIDDDVYVVGGEFYVTQLTYSPVWRYNLNEKQWYQMTNFPHPGDVTKNEIYPYNLKYNNKGFVVIENDHTIELWRYNNISDDWSKITEYPGIGSATTCGFIIDNSIYLGGGYFNKEMAYDFWSFNFITNEWNQLNNLPINYSYLSCNLSCVYESKAYTYIFSNELWEYNPINDVWNEKSKLPGPERFTSNLVLLDNKFYLLGGSYSNYGHCGLKDCWQYSIASDSWELKSFMPSFFSKGIAFNYEGKIIAGLGYVTHGYSHYDLTQLYQLSFNNQ